MTKLSARFENVTGSKLSIFAREGKRGSYNVGASLRTPGEPTRTGCRDRFTSEGDASKAFETLVADALKKGWSEIKVERKTRSAFDAIPLAKPPKKSAA
jgi:hypothetical protein